MAETHAKSFHWYRNYVLFVLVIFCVCSTNTRNLPSYLIAVPVPVCEDMCKTISSPPLCGLAQRAIIPQGRPLTTYERCQLCRQRLLAPSELYSMGVVGAGPGAVLAGRAAFLSGSDGADYSSFHSAPVADFYNFADGACLHFWDYGVLIGVGFAVPYAIGSVPAGWICDRRPRVTVMFIALLLFSVASALQASTHSFWSALICRAVVGFAQAFVLPPVISVAADYFPEQEVKAISVLHFGFHLGSCCASVFLVVASLIGWRWVVLLAGLLGVAVALLLFKTVREPERSEWSAPCAGSVVVDEVLYRSRVSQLLICAGSLKMFGSFSLMGFLPIWFARRSAQGYSALTYALVNALAIVVGGVLSGGLGIFLGRRWSSTDSRAPCWIGVIGSMFSIPMVIFMTYVNSFDLAMVFYFLLIVANECWHGPALALLQVSVRKSVRGQAVALFHIIVTILGNTGPALLGFVDTGGDHIGVHLVWIIVVCNCAASLFFLRAAREISLDPIAGGAQSSNREEVYLKPGTAHWTVF